MWKILVTIKGNVVFFSIWEHWLQPNYPPNMHIFWQCLSMGQIIIILGGEWMNVNQWGAGVYGSSCHHRVNDDTDTIGLHPVSMRFTGQAANIHFHGPFAQDIYLPRGFICFSKSVHLLSAVSSLQLCSFVKEARIAALWCSTAIKQVISNGRQQDTERAEKTKQPGYNGDVFATNTVDTRIVSKRKNHVCDVPLFSVGETFTNTLRCTWLIWL